MLEFRIENFSDTRSFDRLTKIYELVTEKKLWVKDTGIAYRVINHWDKMGIIQFGRETKEGNRKFSFVDFVWVKIVSELRNFGMKVPLIQQIYSEIFEQLPMKKLLDAVAQNPLFLKGYEGEDKHEMMKFYKSGAYKKSGFENFGLNLNYLHLLIAEAIETHNMVALIIFEDGEWFPYIKSQADRYPLDLIRKKECSSQVRINITDIIYKYIAEDYLTEYSDGLGLFTDEEILLLNKMKEGDYKNVEVISSTGKNHNFEIKKSKTSVTVVVNLIREKNYKELILTDKKNNIFKVKEDSERSALKEREKIFAEFSPSITSAKNKGLLKK